MMGYYAIEAIEPHPGHDTMRRSLGLGNTSQVITKLGSFRDTK